MIATVRYQNSTVVYVEDLDVFWLIFGTLLLLVHGLISAERTLRRSYRKPLSDPDIKENGIESIPVCHVSMPLAGCWQDHFRHGHPDVRL